MRKKRILLTFLTLIVFVINFQISYADGEKIVREIEGLTVTSEGYYKVPYGKTKKLTLKQDKNVELDIKQDKDVVLLLDASDKETTPSGELPKTPFKYALFAGAEEINGNKDVLVINGNDISVTGSSHSNGNIRGGLGSGSVICGADDVLSSVGEVNVSGNDIKIEKKEGTKDGVSVIPMPDMREKFAVDAKTSGSYFSTTFNTKTGMQYFKDILTSVDESVTGGDIKSEFGSGLKCTYSKSEYSGDSMGTWEVNGDSLVLREDLPLFFDGNVKFSLNNITGNGFIIATGNILFNSGKETNLGLKYKYDGTIDLENSSEIGFYSIAGDIDFNMVSGAKFKGIVYAPGSFVENDKGELVRKGGKVQMSTDYFELYGSLVASTLILYGNKTIHYVETSLHKKLDDSDDSSSIEFANVQSVALKIAGELAKDKNTIDMATIVYSDKAHILGKGFYTINEEEELGGLTGLINDYETKEGSNLSDGLRLAYHTLREGKIEDRDKDGDKDSDDVALDDSEKFLIVLSYNKPTRYTDVDVSFTDEVSSGDSRIKVGEAEALDKAEDVAKIIKNEKFDSIYFIDINSKSVLSDVQNIIKGAGAKDKFMFDPQTVIKGGIPEQTFEGSLESAVNSILEDISYIPKVKDVRVAFNKGDKKHILPDKVEFVPSIKEEVIEDGKEKTIENEGNFEFDEATRELSLKDASYEIDLLDNKTKAKISDLEMFAKFSTITDSQTFIDDPIKFEETELIYTFTLTDRLGDEETVSIGVPVNKLDIRVEWLVDIN